MKVKCNPFIYTGTCDNLVYYYNKRLGMMIARRYVYPRLSSQNRKISAISRNLKALEISAGYKRDLVTYVALAAYQGGTKHYVNWRNAFLTLMFALARQNPQVDLLTLTRAQIYSDNLPCKTLTEAVEAGLIEPVNGYEQLDMLL